MSTHDMSKPLSQPGTASAEEGHVFLDGPDGVAITLTPDAAITTGKRLVAAGEEARDQGNSEPAVSDRPE